ncbi:MAG: SUF system Fe-S cluster assembly regulator [Alphaproteobacteria bacterium]
MLRLPKLTDYAVVLLAALAAGEGATAAVLAARAGLPLPTVSKILKRLAKTDLVSAQRGTGGGYRLGLPAANISVADIVAAMDGPVSLTQCVDGHHGQCGVESRCAMRGHWNKINGAIRVALESVSLAEMTQGPPIGWPADAHLSQRAE